MTELLGSSLRTRESIRYGESEGKTFRQIIESASTSGWHTFDQGLLKAVEDGIVTEETALLNCSDKTLMRQQLDLWHKRHAGSAQVEVSGLKMDRAARSAATPTSRPNVIYPSRAAQKEPAPAKETQPVAATGA